MYCKTVSIKKLQFSSHTGWSVNRKIKEAWVSEYGDGIFKQVVKQNYISLACHNHPDLQNKVNCNHVTKILFILQGEL